MASMAASCLTTTRLQFPSCSDMSPSRNSASGIHVAGGVAQGPYGFEEEDEFDEEAEYDEYDELRQEDAYLYELLECLVSEFTDELQLTGLPLGRFPVRLLDTPNEGMLWKACIPTE